VTIQIIPVDGIGEVHAGDDLVEFIQSAVSASGGSLRPGDVVVIAQKVVSKAEGRIRRLAEITPSERALRLAAELDKDARIVQCVLDEARAVLRAERGVIITETHHGFVCANSGVDRSNVGLPDAVVLLPLDPDASAAGLREAFRARTGTDVAVVVTDTFGRAWREGQVNVAIGISGLAPFVRYAGLRDPDGYELRVTEIALGDEIAAAAELVMGKLDRRPAAIVRGITSDGTPGGAREYVRPAARDMFR